MLGEAAIAEGTVTSKGSIGEERLNRLLEKTSLRFPSDLESLFIADYKQSSLNMVRIAYLLGILLYSVFGVLDVFIAPLTRNLIWLIRFAIVCPFLALSFGLTWTRFFPKIMEIISSMVVLLAGYGIILMIVIAKDPTATRLYYAGLMLVLMYAYTFTKIRFIWASVCSWLVVLGYEGAGIFLLRMLQDHDLLINFINNNFFFIGSNVIGMVVCYLMEVYARKDFLRRMLVIESRNLLQVERNTLFEKNRVIKVELEMARRIQEHMIPQKTPNDRIHFLYRPMEEVGGDYFDFLQLKSEVKIGLFLSDVSGHGVPAAFITSMIKSSLSQSTQILKDPARLMRYLNSVLINQTNESFITVFYGVYDSVERTLTYANAGHNPPFICLQDKVIELQVSQKQVPIAFIDNEQMAQSNSSYKNYRIALPAGSKLVLYTDGLVEVRKKDEESVFFKDVIKDKMLELQNQHPREFVNKLYQELVTFREGEDFDDDICLICVDIA
jgi:serine phosphatase RsbU (regulator of sigma subunit)